MTPKDHLFQLIQSLTPKERQVFAIAAKGTRKKSPDYLLFFQALCELDQYGETAFLASKRGLPFNPGYSGRKNALYEKVLQVIRSQRQIGGTEKPLEFQVREQVEDARFLRERKLFD